MTRVVFHRLLASAAPPHSPPREVPGGACISWSQPSACSGPALHCVIPAPCGSRRGKGQDCRAVWPRGAASSGRTVGQVGKTASFKMLRVCFLGNCHKALTSWWQVPLSPRASRVTEPPASPLLGMQETSHMVLSSPPSSLMRVCCMLG